MSNSSSSTVRTPSARGCERCGRRERWDGDLAAWRLVRSNGEKLAGNPHCIHEWDINGTFQPVDTE